MRNTVLLFLALLALPLSIFAADVTGTWKSEFDSLPGFQKYTFTFKQDGTTLTGKASSEVEDRKREAELLEGKVEGDAVSFVEPLTIQENEVRVTYKGKLSPDGNEIKFTREVGDFGKEEIVAKRVSVTAAAAPVSAAKVIRIKAGKSEPVKDAEGNVWLADQGFEGGDIIERPDAQIANTKSPDLYRAEHYSMESFSWPVPNGKYVVKLHFAETYEGISGPGERVFAFNVQGKEFKNFDVWAKAGGGLKAYVETVPVEVNDGKIKITFTPEVENPEINAIEIIPQEAAAATASAAKPAPAIRIKAGSASPFTDSKGNVWSAEQGFEGGSTVERDPAVAIAGTTDAGLFQSEHYSMDSFSCKVPNGKYLAKLYFAETYEGITGPGERVFSFNVQGREFKDFDVWKKAGGANRAYIESVPVEVSNGEFRIVFMPQVENPQINAIEILPQEGQSLAQATVETPAPAVVAAPAVAAPAAAVVTTPAATGPAILQIDAGQVAGKVSPDFFGLMTEEINYSYEGGIYGELIRNRAFKADAIVPSVKPDTYVAGKYLPVSYRPDTKPRFWTAVGGAALVLDPSNPLNEFLNVSLKLDASSASATSPSGIANEGYWGIPVKPETTYTVSFFAKAAAGFAGPVTVSIESADGKTTFASAEIKGLTTEWKKFETKLKTKKVPASKENVFKLTTKTPGTLWLQNVSLFPPTYKNRPNGNRADIMELLAAMKPKYLRLPGGNYVEGNAFNQRFNWKETIGPVEQRPGHPSCWGYWSTDGMGLLEYAEWCEDLNMEPVLAVFAGYCLGGGGHVEAGPKLEPYVQEALEEIEYLTGDAKTTKWGARRAQDGHPKPFPLRYVEVGNEDWFDRSGSYEGRFAQFFDAIKAKYPHLKVISSMGHEQPERVWVKGRLPDLVDEHFYRNQQDMEVNFHQYDKRSRAADQSKVFVGEWATRVGSPTPNMAGALGDAVWMCGMERNSDVILMECFAPLFVNVSQLTGRDRSMQWESDLIGYDALNSYGSPSYYVETMFAQNCGTDILPVKAEGIPVIEQPVPGRRGGTSGTRRVSALYYSATREAKSGVVYLKLVNVDAKAQRVSVQLNGVKKVSPKGEAVVLSASKVDDTNSITDPNKLSPRTETVGDLSTNFTRELPPFSVTVLKLKAK